MKLTLLQKIIVAIVWIAVSSNNNIIFCVQGFIIPHPHSHSHPQQHQYPTISSYESTTILYAQKKKRRRRKDSSSSNDEASSSFINNNDMTNNNEEENDEDELPDFDLVEDIDLPLQSSTSTSTSNSSTKKKTIMNPDDPSVIAAMKATSTNPLSTSTSTKDLLKSRNRELEQKFVVDEISQDLPSFADYNSKKGRDGSSSANNSGMGKKAMRREQRKAAALEAQGNIGSEEEDGNPFSQLLSKLPFGGNGGAEEKENKSIIKVRHCDNIMNFMTA